MNLRNHGHLNQEAVDLAHAMSEMDFATCQRSDGTTYGTSGSCQQKGARDISNVDYEKQSRALALQKISQQALENQRKSVGSKKMAMTPKGGAAIIAAQLLGAIALEPLSKLTAKQLDKVLIPAARALDDAMPGMNSADERRRKG